MTPIHHALALAYFKEGYPYSDDNHLLFERVSDGGDLEFFTHVLEHIIPIIEHHLEQYDIELPDKLYVFYGDALPVELNRLFTTHCAPSNTELVQCVERALNTITANMSDIRHRHA
ncbi:hypothetical protein AAFX24_18025 [Vibrio mediterranei]|uniref:hypothetical protein n=1 Tax=Vibrio mediterranei TaxID=689 RepID=UPI0038CEB922